MITIRKSEDRGDADFGWLKSKHSFSFGNYYDPGQMGFGPLRVINEDRVAGGGGFSPHSHANMEIVSYVLDGALEHKDSLGTGSTIRPGDVQRMSAGTGVTHSEYNPSREAGVHFLQIWIQPDKLNVNPRYDQLGFPRETRQDQLRLVISPDGAEGSIAIHQDAKMYASLLSAGTRVTHALGAGRRAWVQVVLGAVSLNGEALKAGDGAAIEAESRLEIEGSQPSELLLFDLP